MKIITQAFFLITMISVYLYTSFSFSANTAPVVPDGKKIHKEIKAGTVVHMPTSTPASLDKTKAKK